MTTTPTPGSPTWYDVLGVEHDATAEEIKAAWRQATDRFEPGSSSGQFRMYNEAADVLLDPQRRAAYDAMLVGPAREEEVPAPVPAPLADPAPVVETAPAGEDAVSEDSPPRPQSGFVRLFGRVSPIVLAVLAVLTVAVVVVAVVLVGKVRQQSAVSSARDEAPAAAESAVKALFSYDYRDLDADRKRSENYLTGTFEKTYLKNFDALKQQKDGSPGLAVQSKAVVTADVQGSGVVDAAADGTQARVLVFVNVVSHKGTADPQIFQNRVAMTMRKEGDRWLVSNVDSY